MAQNGQGISPALLDDIINRLLEFRQARTARQVQLSEAEIRLLCTTSREIFLQQPNLLELEAPIKICGIQIRLFSFIYINIICVIVFAVLFPVCHGFVVGRQDLIVFWLDLL